MDNNIIPSDSQGLFVNLQSSAQGQAIVSPSLLPVGVAGFVFDIQGEDAIELRSEITDHYIEKNTSIQDQWGRLPERITLKGYVGELVGYLEQLPPVTNTSYKTLPIHAGLVPQILAGFGLPASLTPVVNSFVGQIANQYNIPPTVTAQISSFISETPPSQATTASGFINSILASYSLPPSVVNQITAYTTAAVNGVPADVVSQDVAFSAQTVANLPSGWKQAATSFAAQQVASTISSLISPVSSINNTQSAANAYALTQYSSIQSITQQTAAEESTSLYSYYSGFADASGSTKQAQAFGFFYQLWLSAQTCSVQTPWGTMENMAIENLRVTQIEESKYISDFSITFKKIRYINTISIDIGQLAGRAYTQTYESNFTNNGNIGLVSSSTLTFGKP